MDMIKKNVSAFLLWIPLGCVFIGSEFSGSRFEMNEDRVPKFFYQLFYWIGIILFFLTILLLIVKLFLNGFKSILEAEPQSFLSLFNILTFLDYFVVFLKIDQESELEDLNIYLYLHIIILICLVIYGLYLMIFKEKSMLIPEIVTIAFLDNFHSDLIGLWPNSNSLKYPGWNDLKLFYGALKIYGFWLFIIQIFINIGEIKSNNDQTLLNLGFFTALVFLSISSPIALTGRYPGLIPWCVLLVMVIMYLFKNKMNSNKNTLVIAFIGLSLISSFAAAQNSSVRSIYRVFALIGLYFSFVIGICLIILYFIIIIKGEKSTQISP